MIPTRHELVNIFEDTFRKYAVNSKNSGEYSGHKVDYSIYWRVVHMYALHGIPENNQEEIHQVIVGWQDLRALSKYFQMSSTNTHVSTLSNEMSSYHFETTFRMEHVWGHRQAFPEEPLEERRDTCETPVEMVLCMPD